LVELEKQQAMMAEMLEDWRSSTESFSAEWLGTGSAQGEFMMA